MVMVRPSRRAGRTRTHRHTFELAGAKSYRIQLLGRLELA
jgi:hypothetical protein